MKRILRVNILLVGITTSAVPVGTAWAQSNVDPAHKFAWGENIGWTDWRDANGATQGVNVGATFLSSFIWAENIGFINVGDGTPANGVSYANVDGTDFGVNRDAATDELFGYAWGENIGWINFDGGALASPPNPARLDTAAGRLRGYGWGENVGWINLDDATHFVGVLVSIVAANPPLVNPFIAGTQPFRDVLQPGTSAALAQGIGAAGIPSQDTVTYGTVSVTFSGTPSQAPSVTNITATCNGSGPYPCPSVSSVAGSGAGPYLLTLSGPIPPRNCTTLTFAGTNAGQKVQYQSLPGDMNFSGSVSASDINVLVIALNNGQAAVPANLPRYNINRVGTVSATDLARLVQLLNGVNTTQQWLGATVAVCP